MASEWLRKKAQEQAGDNKKLSQGSTTQNTGRASNWLRNKAREQETENQGKQISAASQNQVPMSEPVQKQQVGGKFVRQSLGDDVLPTGTSKISEKMQRYEATKAAQTRADMAQKEYEDYIANLTGVDYRQYQLEDQVKEAHKAAALMPNAQPLAQGTDLHKMVSADPKAKELQAKAGYYAAEAQKARDTQILWDDMEELETWSEADRAALIRYIDQKNQENLGVAIGLQTMGADYAAADLMKKYGLSKVRQMAESYTRWENEEQSQPIQEQAQEFADKHPWIGTGASIPANLLGNISGIAGYAIEAGGRTGRYSTMDPNNVGTMPGTFAAAVRGQVAQKIAGDQYDEHGNLIKDGGILRQSVATLYDAGMSAVDNAARMVFGPHASLALAATGSFGQTMKEASANGASPGQAVALATASAGLEVLTEKVSLDNLLKQVGGGKLPAKQVLKNAFIAAGVEISEEELSFLGNLAADAAIMQGKSEYNQHIGQLMAQGMKYEDAKEQASRALWDEAANTAVISGLSGGMMSGGASMVNNAVYNLSDWAARQAEGKTKTDTQEQAEDADEEESAVPGLSLPTPGVSIETKEHVKPKIVAQAGRLSKATGREIVFYTAEATENGIENGFFKDGKIYINTRSKNPIAQIVSHELTHSVEFADAYQDLSRTVFGQIERMGADLQSLRQQKADLYEQNGHALENQTAVDQEIVAEFVEQYLLSDEQTILQVAGQNRTLGQRIMGWIDNLLVKLGDERAQERRFLTNARNLWAKALEQSRSGQISQQTTQTQRMQNQGSQTGQTVAAEKSGAETEDMLEWARNEYAAGRMSEEDFDSAMDYIMQQEEMDSGWVEFSISRTDDNKPFVDVKNDILSGVPQSDWVNTVKNNLKHKFPNGVTVGRNEIRIDKRSREELTFSGYMRWLKNNDPQAYQDKLRATDNADEILLATTDWINESPNHSRKDKIADFGRGNVLMRIGGNDYTAKVVVGTESNGRMRLYDILDLQPTQFKERKTDAAIAANPSPGAGSNTASVFKKSLSQNGQDVNQQFSISATDKRGIASDLRSILSRGGNTAELRRYIDTLERSDGRAFQRGAGGEQNGTQQIIQAARRSGISVQEYLQENWEQYDVDGQWNEDARKALDLERQGRRYSISGVDNQSRELNETENKAVEIFGTTSNFEEAGYILPDGRLLRFTDDQNKGTRNYDHRAIAMAYGADVDLAKNHGFSFENGRYVDEFVDAGNIRFDAGDPDLDMDIGLQLSKNVPLTKAQEMTIRDLVEWKQNREADFEANLSEENFLYSGPLDIRLDFGENSEYAVGSSSIKDLEAWGKKALEYKGNKISAAQIINDVRHFYKTGEIVSRSNLSQYRYSISETAQETEKSGEDTEKKTAEQIREEMPADARSFLAGAEKKLLNGLGQKLGVSKFQNREQLQEIVREIANEYLEEGRVREESMEFLFDRAYAEGIVQDWSFYNEHKEIKNHLRTTGVTLSQQDQSNIPDFNDFRKRAFGTVKIVNNGLPVDSAYHELHEMAPGLFPESITHPADQLMRMYEVGQSIRVAEVGLQKFYGEDAENHRQWAQYEFGNTVNEVIQDLRSVKSVAEEAARKNAEREAAPTTPEEAAEYYKQLKDARKTYEKARAKNLLTEDDEIQVGRLLRGEIQLEHLDPEKNNVRAITNVYEAKQEYERLTKLINQYKSHVRGQRREAADKILETAPEWKDKKVGIAYSRETMERNIYDIVPDKNVAEQVNEAYFRPVHDAEANAVRFKNEHRDLVRKLDLSRKVTKGNLVSEAHAVQLLGEAEDNIRVLQNSRGRVKQRDGKTIQEWQAVIDDMWAQSPKLDQTKIRNAVAEFRKIYDKLFQQMNEVRVRNGYEPVNYRQGYFPHFQPGDGDGVLAHFGKVLGIDTQVAALPTSINGLTHTFRPGIQWFGNAQERLGFNTAYDAVEGFDKYLEGVSSVIFQTDNIQNLRALESQIRYRTTNEGIRKQVDAVNADTRLTEEEKQIKINSIYEHGRYTLSNFVVELSEYTNLLANKKSKLDRTMEGLIGRRAYTIMKAWESRVGANMIAGNISSAMTNFIPLTQAGAQLSSDSMIRGMWGTLKSYKEDDGIPGMSTFLTNRRGSDPLVKTWAQTASEKMGMNFLMDLVDGFTSDTIVRAAYYQNLKNGLSEAEALHQADIFAASVMADRSKGSMPTLFESTNPLFKMFTQFQLEVNNQFSEIFKDLPRRHKEKGLMVMMGVLLKYFIGAFLYNELYEYFAGRRPALDPLSMLNNAVGDMTGYELPNVIEWIGGDADFETEKVGAGQAAKNLASSALGELPFSSGLTLLGIETDGGRLPASSAVPDLTALWDAATTEGWSKEKRWKEAKDELGKLMYVVPPFGGNQIQKTWKGIKAYMEGGSYNVDKDGNDILQYPVFKDSPEDQFWNLVRAAFMGKSSLAEAQDWVDSGFDSFSAKQTTVYQDMVESGVKDREAYDLLRKLEKAQKTNTATKKAVQCGILQNSNMDEAGKAIAYYGLVASEKERELMDALTDIGADPGDAMYSVIDLEYGNQLKGMEKKQYQAKTVAGSNLTEEGKVEIVGHIMGKEMTTEAGNPTEYAKFLSAADRGLSADQYMEMRAKGADVDDFLEVTDAGVSPDTAIKYSMSMVEMAAKEDTSKLDKWRLSVNFSNKASDQLALLSLVMTDEQFVKVEKAHNFGVKPSSYVELQEILPKFDTNGNGTYTQKEAKAAIDSMRVSNAEKAVLWQLMNSSWKGRNNPFDKKIGQQIEDSMGE